MKVVIRADAGIEQGTGHVMRCLTLSEELLARGHQVDLVTGGLATDWLAEAVAISGVGLHHCEFDTLPVDRIIALKPDWVVVDSYQIPSCSLSALAEFTPLLAVVDGDYRGIQASLYLDQNLGAESVVRPVAIRDRFLSGAKFTLVRDSVLAERRPGPSGEISSTPRVLTFMGGTDPTHASLGIAEALAKIEDDFELVILAPSSEHSALRTALGAKLHVRLLAPTRELPALFSEADVIVSAAGTSAWDICAIGIPAVLISVVENQRTSVREAVSRGLALGLDVTDDRSALQENAGELVSRLLHDTELRRRLSQKCLSTFDGDGKGRVADVMEAKGDMYASVRRR